MKKLILLAAVLLMAIGASAQSKVYFTKEISPEASYAYTRHWAKRQKGALL